MKKTLELHPFLIAFYPVLYLYSVNVHQLSISVILVPLVVLGVIALLLLMGGMRILGNSGKAALCVSVFFLWFFSYSAVRSMIVFEIAGLQVYRHRVFILIWTVVLLLSLILVLRVRLNYAKISKALNIFAVLLILFPLWTIITNRNNHSTSLRSNIASQRNKSINLSARTDTLPDIYYIILDAYTGQKALKQYLDFDNSEFVQYLRGKGFFVAEESHSNYAWTSLLMASSLNMDYLPTTVSNKVPNTLTVDSTVSEYELIVNNKVVDFLQSKGYRFIDLSIWANQLYVRLSRYPSEYVTTDFNLLLLKLTILDRPLVENYILGQVKRERTLRKFNDLKEVPDNTGPVFVYAHLLIPHHPYVFDRYGNLPPFHKMMAEAALEKDMYLEQLLFTNKKLEETIDVILTKSRRRPIIVVQGDHGAYQLAEGEDANAKLRMSILNAYYLPPAGEKLLYDNITPVNTFRVIFNACFGKDYMLLPDHSFFSKMNSYRQLVDVTPILRE